MRRPASPWRAPARSSLHPGVPAGLRLGVGSDGAHLVARGEQSPERIVLADDAGEFRQRIRLGRLRRLTRLLTQIARESVQIDLSARSVRHGSILTSTPVTGPMRSGLSHLVRRGHTENRKAGRQRAPQSFDERQPGPRRLSVGCINKP